MIEFCSYQNLVYPAFSTHPATSISVSCKLGDNLRMIVIEGVFILVGDNILTALSVARDSGMIPPDHCVILLTTQHATNNNDRKLLVAWSSLSNELRSDVNISQKSNGDELRIKQVSVANE
jgi:hypothetical protein